MLQVRIVAGERVPVYATGTKRIVGEGYQRHYWKVSSPGCVTERGGDREEALDNFHRRARANSR